MSAAPEYFDEPEAGAVYHCYSATQIDTFLECRRKWAWDKIARIPRGQNKGAQVGDRCHLQLEKYLDGQELDFTEVVHGVKIGDVCASVVHLLPTPCEAATGPETKEEQRARHARHGLAIETSFRWQSPKTGFVYVGRKDVEVEDSGTIPGIAEANGLEPGAKTGVPGVLDHKHTSSIASYAKSDEDLEWDAQSGLYAYDAIVRTGSPLVDLAWNYGQTKGARYAERRHLRVHRDHAVKVFRAIESVARDMTTIHERAPKFDNAPRDGIEGPPDMGKEWRETLARFVEGINPNASACEKYGGCPYRHLCALTPKEGAFRFMSNATTTDNDPLFDSLRKRAAAQDGSTPKTAAAPPPPPEMTSAPADDGGLLRKKRATDPTPTTAPVVITEKEEPTKVWKIELGDKVYVGKGATTEEAKANARAQADADLPPKPNLAQPDMGAQAAVDRGVADIDLKAAVRKADGPAINPPEVNNPPIVLPPSPVATTSEDEGDDDAPAEDVAPKRKGGRPKGSKNKAKDAPRDPLGADALAHTTPNDPRVPTPEQTAAALPAMKAHVDQVVADAERAGIITKADTCTAPGDAAEPCAERLAFDLYVDCMPVCSGHVAFLEEYIPRAHAIMNEAFKNEGEPEVDDFRFIGYGKGKGVLALSVVAALRENPPAALVVRSSTDEASAVLGTIKPFASTVTVGIR